MIVLILECESETDLEERYTSHRAIMIRSSGNGYEVRTDYVILEAVQDWGRAWHTARVYHRYHMPDVDRLTDWLRVMVTCEGDHGYRLRLDLSFCPVGMIDLYWPISQVLEALSASTPPVPPRSPPIELTRFDLLEL